MANFTRIELKSILLSKLVVLASVLRFGLFFLIIVLSGQGRWILTSVKKLGRVSETRILKAFMVSHFAVHQLLNVLVQLVQGHDKGRQNDQSGQTWKHFSDALACSDCQAASERPSHSFPSNQRLGYSHRCFSNWWYNCRRRCSRFLSILSMTRVPLIQCFLSLLLLGGKSSLVRPPRSSFLTLLLARRILQYRALNVDLVHEVKRVAWPLELIVKALRVLLFHKLFQLAHASFLSGSRVASEQPWFLLENREILHFIVLGLFFDLLLALWITIHGTLAR